mmetsp:Transcript_61890/g.147395  ORF Transcript_61890/g.147395 Transcript_61890/m.147395 type:complete len:308 (-) Transcript_61890:408-1331(-)
MEREERMAHPLLPRAARAADAVHVVLRREREGVIDHKLHVRDVEAAGGDVRGDQEGAFALLEVVHRGCPDVLRTVAVDRVHLEVGLALDKHVDPVSLLFVKREDDDAVGPVVVLLEHLDQPPVLDLGVQNLDDLLDAVVGGELLGPHRHARGVRQELRRNRLDGHRPGGGEHEGLALLGAHRNDPPDVLLEPEVEHAVGLIQDEERDPRQVGGLLLAEVEQAPWRRDQHVRPRPEQLPLFVLGHAAVDAEGADSVGLPRCFHHHRALHRKLAGRREHEDGGVGLPALVEALPQDVRQPGQPKAQRLA